MILSYLKAFFILIRAFLKPQKQPVETVSPVNEPVVVSEPVATPAPVPVTPKYLFDTQQNARHSIRVICDEEGLSLLKKNELTACIEEESQFRNFYNGLPVKHQNKNAAGKVLSTDWGICQINDHYHIGMALDFPSVQYVLDNPDRAVRWMARMFKAGRESMWVSYTSGAYEKHMPR